MSFKGFFVSIFLYLIILGLIYLEHITDTNILVILGVAIIVLFILAYILKKSGYGITKTTDLAAQQVRLNEQMQKWSTIRQNGAGHYTLVYGTYWSFLITSLFFIREYLGTHLLFTSIYMNFIWIPLGYIWAYIVWRLNESRYEKWVSGKGNMPPS